jgi:hypothetical protein
LVSAVARVVEDKLGEEQARRDSRLRDLYLDRIATWSSRRTALVSKTGRVLAASPHGWAGDRVTQPVEESNAVLPDGSRVVSEPLGLDGAHILLPAPRHREARSGPKLRAEVLGRRRARVTVGGQRIKLTPKHSEILVLLLLNRDGLSGHELGIELYGPEYHPVTVRAEISRMRRLLGPMLATRPYRLDAELHTDLNEVESLLERNDPGAAERYRGPLLAGSDVAAISSARERLEQRISACRETHS